MGLGQGGDVVASVQGDHRARRVGCPCYPNCDGSTIPPTLNIIDFACFLNRFAAGDSVVIEASGSIPTRVHGLEDVRIEDDADATRGEIW